MNKRTFSSLATLSVILLLSISGFVGVASSEVSEIPRPDHLVIASIWGPETVDPAWVYDTASATVIMNVYDTLIDFYVDTSRPSVVDWGRVDEFSPNLATEWLVAQPPHPSAPADTNSTYYFKIRENIPWHDSAYGYVAPEDAEYSFERWMAFDRTGGPTWMIYEPLLNCYFADWTDPDMATKIDKAVESNSTHVWFNLMAPNYPPMIFMQVIAQSWASAIPKAWATDHGCWPGETYTNDNMSAYYDPVISPLDEAGYIECGSGPYKLTDLDAVAHTWRLDWFEDYWRGWPCEFCDGWLKTITFRGIDEWETRKAMFVVGDADFCYVPRLHLPEMVVNWDESPSWSEEEYPSGISCWPGLPSMIEMNMVINLNITLPNPNIGAPPYDEIHESGIPYWFFSEAYASYTNGGKYVRKAMAYCLNWTEYMQDVVMGEGIQPSTCQIKGNAYWQNIWDVVGETDELAYKAGAPDPSVTGSDLNPPDTVTSPPYSQPTLPNGSDPLPPVPCYYRNLAKAEEMFKLAWDGEVWEKGFTFDMLYNTGNEMRMVAAYMMEEAVESINPKFHVNVREVDWPTFLGEMDAGRLSCWYIGWLADYPDPHNWFYPYMHSHGTFSDAQGYGDPEVDALIEAGVAETDDNKRIEIYWKLANIFHDEAFNLPLYQSTGRHWSRTWVQGWYYNPIYPGDYYYHLWKYWRYTPPSPPPVVSASTVYGTSVPISVAFVDPVTEEPAAGFLVFIQQSPDNVTWTNIGATITDENGCVNVSVTPSLGTVYYRAYFTGYTAPTPASAELNPKYYEQLIVNGTLGSFLLPEIGTWMEVETKAIEEILTDALTPMATKDDVNSLSTSLSSEISDLSSAISAISSLTTLLYASIGIAVIAIIVAIVALIKK